MDLAEHSIQNAIVRWVALHDECRVFRQNTGVAKYGKHTVRFGVPGQPDLHGIVAPVGRYFGVEVKGRSGRLSKAQAAYRDMMLSLGAVHVTARCVEDVWAVFREEFPHIEWLTPAEVMDA